MRAASTLRLLRAGLYAAATIVFVAVTTGACGAAPGPLVDSRSAGDATVDADGSDAFSLPVANADAAERAAFDVGNRFFQQDWQPAPASADIDGLGPLFNATSCIACHAADGRSSGPDTGLVTDPGFVVFFSGGADPVYGMQIQDRAVDGVVPEARISVVYDEVAGTYADGTPYTLRRPTVMVEEPAFGVPSTPLSARVAPPLIGMGLLDAIPAEAVAAGADPEDADNDGISGRIPTGRFGWKGSVPSLHQQTALALYHDIGITSDVFPEENCPPLQEGCANVASGGDPEVGEGRIGAIVTYVRLLAVPVRRDLETTAVAAGAELFTAAGCDACHRPTFVTGDVDLRPLSGQEIHAFTDLLLHDMGDGLADHGSDGQEWRTPPLWGIGLTGVVGGHTTFLHDGRARSLEEAVLWHGGEADAARRVFLQMSERDRDALIAFLRSL